MSVPVPTDGPIAYVMKRYPRLSETFIVNEIRAMERLGGRLRLFSLLPPEPPPHHPIVAEIAAPLIAPPPTRGAMLRGFAAAHGRMIASHPLRYLGAAARAAWWSAQAPRPGSVWKQFARGGFVADHSLRAGVRHIHAHFANAPAAVARFASLMSGIPFSFTAHAKDLYLTPKRTIWRRARAARFVVTCTEYNAAYLRALLGAESGRVHRVYHGIDLGLFSAAAPRPMPAEPLILSVGRLVEKKGHDDLIAALARLRDRGVAFRAVLVGAGPLRAALEALIAAEGLTERVTLRGAMTHAALIDLYREADLFALAPRIAEDGDRDGIPNVIAEAMAIGVPVVATAISGIPELVEDGLTGRLVPPRDPAALAGAMAMLLADPAEARRLAAAGRARLERDFDLWTTTGRLHALMGGECCAPAAAPGLLMAEAVS